MFSLIKENWIEVNLWFCMAAILVAVVAERTIQSVSIKLDREEWVCTKTEQRSHTHDVLIGKAIIPIVDVVQECVEYKRVKE